MDATHGEVKHLSTRGREINRDCLSSGERTGNSPNSGGVIADTRCRREVVGSVRSLVLEARFTRAYSGRVWNGPPKQVRVLYAKYVACGMGQNPEYHRTRGTRWEPGETTLQG